MHLDDCDRYFSQFENANSLAERCFSLGPILDNYQLINVEFGRGRIFWRARHCQPNNLHCPNQMSYPPAEITRAGRLNDPNDPCLYTATMIETALHEIGAKEDDHVQLVGYRALAETPLRVALVGELLHVYKMGYIRYFGEDPDSTIKKLLNSFDVNTAKRIIYIDTYLSQTMSDVEARASDYVRSRAVSAMIYRMQEVDGIIYPSVRDILGMNLTLRSESADHKTHPVSCILVKVGRVRRHGFLEYEVLKDVERIDENGEFVWKPVLPYPRRRFFNLSKEEYELGKSRGGDPNAYGDMLSMYNPRR